MNLAVIHLHSIQQFLEFLHDPFGLRRRKHRTWGVSHRAARRLEAWGTVPRLRDGASVYVYTTTHLCMRLLSPNGSRVTLKTVESSLYYVYQEIQKIIEKNIPQETQSMQFL